MLPEVGTEHLLDPTAPNTAPKKDVDLKDPNKYCALCAASFNNPQMALQHYNGRKHQRNQARQDLLKDLGDNVQEGNTGSCVSHYREGAEPRGICVHAEESLCPFLM